MTGKEFMMLRVLLLALFGLGLCAGCTNTAKAARAGQAYFSTYVFDFTGELKGNVRFNTKYIYLDGDGAGDIVIFDQVAGVELFRYSVKGAKGKAFELLILDEKPYVRLAVADPAVALAALAVSPRVDA